MSSSTPPRSSSGRLIKKNTKYGEIQGRAFERVVQRIVGPDPLALSDDEYDSESAAGGGEMMSEYGDDPIQEHSSSRLGQDLGPDDVTRCVICWGACTPASAAAAAYNRLNGYLNTHGDEPVRMIVGALGLELDAAAKFELTCHVCAALVRELEEREQQVVLLRQQLVQRFTRSQRLQPGSSQLHQHQPLHHQQYSQQQWHQQREERQQLQRQRDERQQQLETALHTLRAEAQDGMFGVTGLGLPLPEPPPQLPRGGAELLPREEDTVEAYLSRRDEWITQTPGAARGLARAMAEASADGVTSRPVSLAVQPHPCSECDRVFSSAGSLARHEYFAHQLGQLPPPPPPQAGAGQLQPVASVAVEVVMEEAGTPAAAAEEDTTMDEDDGEEEDGDDGEDNGEDGSGAAEDSNTQCGASAGDGSNSGGGGDGQTPGKRRRGRPRLPDSLALRSGSCQYCGTFIKVDLQGHINRFHTMVRPHQCDLCGERLVSRHALAEHRQVAHGAGRPCEHCGATFARKKQLSMHLWRKHGVGGVQCRICGKKFARSDTLDGHMRCHERPMQCSLCPARFPFKRELRNHEFIKHGLHGEIPRDSDHRPGEMYRCGKCGRCFGSWAGRDRHACDSEAPLSDLYVCQLCGDWSTRFEGDMVKHMRNLHKIEAETILIADVEEEDGEEAVQEEEEDGVEREDAAVGEDAATADDHSTVVQLVQVQPPPTQ